jgi:hypothetical protein
VLGGGSHAEFTSGLFGRLQGCPKPVSQALNAINIRLIPTKLALIRHSLKV